MKRIFVMNLKGGVGKTTLSNEIAYSLDRTNTPYSFFELDTQGGSAHGEQMNTEAVVQIADTPSAHADDLDKWARAADVVVIPVRSSTLDAHAFVTTLRTVRERNPNATIIVIQNGWNRFNASSDFRKWLESKTADMDIQILPLSQSERIIQATAQRKSVVTMTSRKARVHTQMMDIVNAVRNAAGLDIENYETA